MTSWRARQSLNTQSQLHGPAPHGLEAETAAPKQQPNRDPIFVWDTDGGTTLQPTSLPDPIFGYPSAD
jgi:hypothetical protein